MRIKHRKSLAVIAFSFAVLVNVHGLFAQAPFEVKAGPGACEDNNLRIDMLVHAARKNKERVFVISRVASRERYNLNHSRLSYAVAVLARIKGLGEENVIGAIGQRSSKGGRLEFYVGSELFLISNAEPGKQICLLCCQS